MEALTVKDIVLLILGTILTVGIAVIGYSIRTIHADIKNKVKEAIEKAAQADRDLVNLKIALPDKVKEAIEKAAQVDRDLMEFKAKLSEKYVLRDDYIRNISVFEHKLDNIAEKSDQKFTEMNKKIDAQFETVNKKIDLITRRENG